MPRGAVPRGVAEVSVSASEFFTPLPGRWVRIGGHHLAPMGALTTIEGVLAGGSASFPFPADTAKAGVTDKAPRRCLVCNCGRTIMRRRLPPVCSQRLNRAELGR